MRGTSEEETHLSAIALDDVMSSVAEWHESNSTPFVRSERLRYRLKSVQDKIVALQTFYNNNPEKLKFAKHREWGLNDKDLLAIERIDIFATVMNILGLSEDFLKRYAQSIGFNENETGHWYNLWT